MPDAAKGPVRGVLAAAALVGASMMHTPAAAVPPPAEQETANCAAPVFATDQLVCEDPVLRERDRELAALLAEASIPAMPWAEPQSAWFLRRSRCAFVADHAACAAAAYDERLALLRPPPPIERRRPIRCKPGGITAVASSDNWLVLFGEKGEVLGVARNGSDTGGWQPFLPASRSGRKLTIRPPSGAPIACRLS